MHNALLWLHIISIIIYEYAVKSNTQYNETHSTFLP